MAIKTNCILCGSTSLERKGKIRTSKQIIASKILECTSCSLVFLNDDTHISESHYQQSLMHDIPPDLNEYRTETQTDDLRRFKMLENNIVDKDILEAGSGNAGFMHLSKTIVKSIVGIEPDLKYYDIFLSEGLNVYKSLDDYYNCLDLSKSNTVDVIVSFHVIEHVKNPLAFLLQLLSVLKVKGKLFIETPNSNDALITLYESSAFCDYTYWDNHLVLFNNISFEFMLNKISGINFKSIPVQRYGIANHLYWLSKGKPNGHKIWNMLENEELNDMYKIRLSKARINDTLFYEITKMNSECKVI